MRRFKYKAKDKSGSLVTGEVEATNANHAAKLVRQKELVVISINPVRDWPLAFLKKFRDRVTAGDITNFTRQLATMINAGLPLTEALLILRSQSKGALQKIVGQILADVEEGQPLSESMAKNPAVFSKSYVALVKSGEVGGVLDEVLARLADALEKQQEFKGRVRGAMIYPIVIVSGMVMVALIMLIFVIPRLTSLYDQFDAELPIPTKILIAVSSFMAAYWPFVLLLVAGLVYGLKLYSSTDKGRRKVDEILLKLPLIGELQKQVLLTDVARTLSLMVGSGVSILESLSISAEVSNNSIISDALTDSATKVEKGFPVAFAFSRHPKAFPYIFSQMIAIGEETGKMDEVLDKIAHVFEVESDQKVKTISAAIEPLILIVLGIGVAFLVISIILPIYNLTTQF